MKLQSILTLAALTLGLTARADVQDIQVNLPDAKADAPAAAPVAAPAAPAFSEVQVIEELGWMMAKRVGISELELSKEQIDALAKGVAVAAEGKDSPHDPQAIGPALEQFMQAKQAIYMERLKKKSAAEALAFFEKLKENKNVVELPSGLRYEIVAPGSGPAPKPSETVKVHYTGALANGTVFDSSVQRGEPVEFELDQVIPGWTEGLQKISKGGKMKLYVPAHLAYGDEGRPGIPPGSTLVFDVELLDIKPPAPAPAPEAAPAPTPAPAPAGK